MALAKPARQGISRYRQYYLYAPNLDFPYPHAGIVLHKMFGKTWSSYSPDPTITAVQPMSEADFMEIVQPSPWKTGKQDYKKLLYGFKHLLPKTSKINVRRQTLISLKKVHQKSAPTVLRSGTNLAPSELTRKLRSSF